MKAYILVYVLSIAVIFGNHYPDPDYKNCLQNHLGGSAATKPWRMFMADYVHFRYFQW